MKYNFLSIPIEIDSPLSEIQEKLANLYGEFRDDLINSPKVRYSALVDNGVVPESYIYKICRDGDVFGHYEGEDEFLLELEKLVMDDVMKHLPHLCFIHAAVVAKDNEAIIFPGRSGAGKSTLAMALAQRNWCYFSDEIAPIEKKTQRVYAFPRGIKLKEGALDLFSLPKKAIEMKNAQRNYFNSFRNKAANQRTTSKIKYILFPDYNPTVQSSLTPVSKTIAVCFLAACSLNFYSDRGDPYIFLRNLVEDVNCYKITTNDIGESCSIIENLFTGPSIKADIFSL